MRSIGPKSLLCIRKWRNQSMHREGEYMNPRHPKLSAALSYMLAWTSIYEAPCPDKENLLYGKLVSWQGTVQNQATTASLWQQHIRPGIIDPQFGGCLPHVQGLRWALRPQQRDSLFPPITAELLTPRSMCHASAKQRSRKCTSLPLKQKSCQP